MIPRQLFYSYAGPIPSARRGRVESQAFHSDWTSSAVLSETYTVDVTLPTIRGGSVPGRSVELDECPSYGHIPMLGLFGGSCARHL